jgi:hypothetical protein
MSPTVTGALADSSKHGCRDAALIPNAADAAAIARATICLVNAERARHRLRRLRSNPVLARVALGQSADMVRGNYFADHSLAGRTPLERIAPALRPAHVATTGQNIGWGTGADATPEAIVRAWMNSPPHRRIILTAAFREAGVGVAASLPAVLERGNRGATYTLDLTAVANGAPATTASARAPRTSTTTSTRRAGEGGERISVRLRSSSAQEVTAG